MKASRRNMRALAAASMATKPKQSKYEAKRTVNPFLGADYKARLAEHFNTKPDDRRYYLEGDFADIEKRVLSHIRCGDCKQLVSERTGMCDCPYEGEDQ